MKRDQEAPPRHAGEPEEDGSVLSTKSWYVGLFCGECGHEWTGNAPCSECGRFSRPAALACREILYGTGFLPWTWEKRYEFAEDEESSTPEPSPATADG